jgi:zinc transporter ZupT
LAIAFGVITFFSTLFGGLFALKLKSKFHLILGFSAGAVIGVVFFDLLPEALSLADKQYDINIVTLFAAAGFLIYMILDRMASLTNNTNENRNHVGKRGNLGAFSLSIHSLLDGVAIGLAFQVSFSIGILVTVAVVVHDFSDGINTVSIVLKDNGQSREAFRWLLVDATAPVVGVISTLFYKVPESSFGLILALFAGFFFYIGASDLLPESHNRYPTLWTTISTILGVAVIYTAIKFAGI